MPSNFIQHENQQAFSILITITMRLGAHNYKLCKQIVAKFVSTHNSINNWLFYCEFSIKINSGQSTAAYFLQLIKGRNE